MSRFLLRNGCADMPSAEKCGSILKKAGEREGSRGAAIAGTVGRQAASIQSL